MTDGPMPLFKLSKNFPKKFTIQLPTRVLEGGVQRHKSGTCSFSYGDRPDGDFQVCFDSGSIQDPDEATAIIHLLQRPYVRKITIYERIGGNHGVDESYDKDMEIELLPRDAATVPVTDLIGTFRSLTVDCTRKGWSEDCLNEDRHTVVILAHRTVFYFALSLLLFVAFIVVLAYASTLRRTPDIVMGSCGLATLLCVAFSMTLAMGAISNNHRNDAEQTKIGSTRSRAALIGEVFTGSIGNRMWTLLFA